MECDYLVVGMGLYGSVLAERIANDSGAKVLIIDKRSHFGGNCYSEFDKDTGIEVHKYGTHVFHTDSQAVWNYINQFTEFNGYHHQVLTIHKNKVYQMPINLETINSFYNLNLKPYEAKEFIKDEIQKEYFDNPQNFEEKAISLIGRPLYEAFVKGYTIKQWGKDPRKLPATIINRLPVRYDYNEDYFLNSRWQGIPLNGYTEIFRKMLSSSNIQTELNCDFFEVRNHISVKKKIIYTGPIDRYFDYRYGELEWRTIELQKEYVDVDDFQGTAVMNYADIDVKYTRVHEFKHLHPERDYINDKTVVFYETSKQGSSEPFYPVNTEENQNILKKYKELASHEGSVIIGGRLGDYAYYDMDKTILSAKTYYEEKIQSERV